MTKKPTWAEIGPIGEGYSLLTEACVIECLADELSVQLARCRVPSEDRKRFVALLRDIEMSANPTEWTVKQPGYLCRSEATYQLQQALATFCPPHSWFGERDGVWGFWPIVDDSELPRMVAGSERSANAAMYHAGEECYITNGHSNVSCGRFDRRGNWHEYWSVV